MRRHNRDQNKQTFNAQSCDTLVDSIQSIFYNGKQSR